MGSRWRKTLALSEKQKQALEFGKDFAAALSLLLSIGFKCLKKPTRCTSSTWHLHLFFQQCQDFCNAVDKLNDKLTVMTDCQSLGMLLQNVFYTVIFTFDSEAAVRKHQSLPWTCCSKRSAKNTAWSMCSLTYSGYVVLTYSSTSYSWPMLIWHMLMQYFLLRSSCDNAPGPRAFIKANFPGVTWRPRFWFQIWRVVLIWFNLVVWWLVRLHSDLFDRSIDSYKDEA